MFEIYALLNFCISFYPKTLKKSGHKVQFRCEPNQYIDLYLTRYFESLRSQKSWVPSKCY